MLVIGFLFVLIMLLFIFSTNSIEGMTTIGKYTYLPPVVPESKWSQDVITKFVDKYNKNLDEKSEYRLNAPTFATDRSSNTFMSEALEEEAKYYIDNGKWPYCHYVSDYLNNNPTAIPSNFVMNGKKITQTNVSTFLSNRKVYEQFIMQMEAKLDPQPESYNIFKGTQPPPLASDSTTKLSGSDYIKLKEICKNVNTA
jgi:hypothetical protein